MGYVADAAYAAFPEPVTLAEAKAQCRVDAGDGADDALLARLISAAREFVERSTGHLLARRARTWTGDAFALARLVDAPITSIDAVTYLDPAGASAVLAPAAYHAALRARPVVIVPAPSCAFPRTAALPGAVTVAYTAGYASPLHVPAALRQAVLMLVGHWYENREAVVVGTIAGAIEFAVEALLADFRPSLFR